MLAPSSPFPPTPPRLLSAPAPSLGREMSQTDPLVLEALLPLLSPASGGSADEAGQPPSMGVASCAVGLAKVMLGVGLVALPRSLLLLGTLPATLAFLVLGALCQLSCNALTAAATQAARSGLPAQRLSYSGVLAMQLGPWAALLLDVATVLNCLGMMTAYLIASGDVLVSDEWRAAGAPSWLAALLRSRPAVLALLSAAVLAPLLSFRRLKQTAAASALGVAAVLVWAAATAYLATVLALRGQAHTLPLWPSAQLRRLPWHRALLRVAAVLPVILTAFM
ncbi:hypothetical protein COHA_005877 [Chlorella ohadii]|uniref:Amino acid transporter transmembrane domain-containing protein n=1 Tax=Chlorella ohadii TaxID=2649997 RepID=A0AAD5DM09_9CHLO|nr:hypothetical protein COHA_005877 [Chlorella ohadii]